MKTPDHETVDWTAQTIVTRLTLFLKRVNCPRFIPHRIVRLALLSLCMSGWGASAADFTVETPGGVFAFYINGLFVPTLTLVRGQTYTFDVQTSNNHPFHIESLGVDNNDINSGIMTFSVPTNNANYSYHCVVHGIQMRGEITTIEPPRIEILSLAVGTNLVLTSTATNNWTLYPEYKTSLGATNWFALTVQSNRFINDTRETSCGRPEGNPVLVRIRASR